MAGEHPGGIVGAVSPGRGAAYANLGAALTNGICRALWVGADGNVSVITSDGDTIIFTGINAGTLLPIQVRQINNAPDTSVTSPTTNIVAIY